MYDDVLDLRRDEAEIDGHRDDSRFGERDIHLHPFDAVVGEERNAIPLLEAQAEERVGELARPRVPLLERHRAARIERAELVGQKPRVRGDDFAKIEDGSHLSVPKGRPEGMTAPGGQ